MRFLVASHHGYGRPFFPAQVDVDEPPVRYVGELGEVSVLAPYRLGSPGSGIPGDYWASVRRFGWFGAAWLESVLRLADHCASREIAARGSAQNGGQ